MTTSIGAVVKLVGIGLGLLTVVGFTIYGSQVDRVGSAFVCGLFIGAIVAIPIFVLGVLVAAHGEVLKGTLDAAVHGSPFLNKEDMAKVMSL